MPPESGTEPTTAYRRAAAIEAAPMQDEVLLFDPTSNKFCVLNRTAAFLWNELSAPQTAAGLSTRVCASFAEVSSEQALGDVARALSQLAELSLIEPVPA